MDKIEKLSKDNPELACVFHAVVIIILLLILLKTWNFCLKFYEGLEDRQGLAFSSGATQRHYQILTASNQDPYDTLSVVEMQAKGTNQAFSGESRDANTAPPSIANATKEKLTSSPENPFFWGVFGEYGDQDPRSDSNSPISWGVGDDMSELRQQISDKSKRAQSAAVPSVNLAKAPMPAATAPGPSAPKPETMGELKSKLTGQPELPTSRQGIKRENFAESKNIAGGANWSRGEDILQGMLLQST